MTLPEIGSIVAVQYQRNPTVYSDAALNPRLHLGRVVRHEGTGGFTVALGNYDHVPQESWLEWNDDLEAFEDRDFHQPIEWVRYPVTGELEALCLELEALPEEIPQAEGQDRPFDEMRLRFLLAAAESEWLADLSQPFVMYSDDFPDAASRVSRWTKQNLGRFEISDERVFFEWPVEEREQSEWGVELQRQPDGSYYSKSEAFGDEFEAKLEEREGCRVLLGLWASEDFMSFFGAVFPKA